MRETCTPGTVLGSAHRGAAESDLCLRRCPQFAPVCAWVHKYLDFLRYKFCTYLVYLSGPFLYEGYFEKMGILYNWAKRTLYIHSLPLVKQEYFKKIHCFFLPLGRNSDFIFYVWSGLPREGLKMDLLMPNDYTALGSQWIWKGTRGKWPAVLQWVLARGHSPSAGNSCVHPGLHPTYSFYWKPQRYQGSFPSSWRVRQGVELGGWPASLHTLVSAVLAFFSALKETGGSMSPKFPDRIISVWQVFVQW